jgi:hypothetical protein
MTYTLEIEQDPEPCNPRTEWDNLTTFVCFHKRYELGDRHDYRTEDYQGWAEMSLDIAAREKTAAIEPVFLMDHSGLAVSTASFSCPWDSGQVGWAYITREKVLEEFGGKILTKKRGDKAHEIILGEVETYNRYLQGDVWGFVIKDEDGEIVDSCWGFFDVDYCRQEGEAALSGFSGAA